MEDVVIRVKNLSKRYKIGTQEYFGGSLINRITGFFSEKLRKKNLNNIDKKENEFYALKDINFELKQGETLGIIGQNGAGKTTLLKILSGITEPTTGNIEIHGRVASILEVGTGFHPDLTGRENVYLSGKMLGLSKKEIDSKFDDIVAFSGVENFIDTAVKYYSSGMYLRLAFSVVVNIDADVLLFDEVLNVGDTEFQQKCLKKLLELTNSNKTILLVSHNMNDILHLCNHVLYIEKGKLDYEGNANTSVSNYLQSIEKPDNALLNAYIDSNTLEKINSSINKKGIKIISLGLFQKGEAISTAVDFYAPFDISVEIDKLNSDYQLNFSYGFIHHGNIFLSSNSINARNNRQILKEKGKYLLTMTFPDSLLNKSVYQVDMYISCEETDETFQIKSALEFSVNDFQKHSTHKIFKAFNKFPGPLDPSFEWKLKKYNDEKQ